MKRQPEKYCKIDRYHYGEVQEWLNWHAWNACVPQGTQGSNPCLSAIEKRRVNNSSFFYGTPDRIRTYGLRLRKPTLYPAELRVQIAALCIETTHGSAIRVTRRCLRACSDEQRIV